MIVKQTLFYFTNVVFIFFHIYSLHALHTLVVFHYFFPVNKCTIHRLTVSGSMPNPRLRGSVG
jgi:hypothetical protein